MNNEIMPFIYYFNIKEFCNHPISEEILLKKVKLQTVRQIIFEEWQFLPTEKIITIYTLLKKYLIKLSFLIDDDCDMCKLNDVICSTYRFYSKKSLSNKMVLEYISHANIELWLISNYSYLLSCDSKRLNMNCYKRIIVCDDNDITKPIGVFKPHSKSLLEDHNEYKNIHYDKALLRIGQI